MEFDKRRVGFDVIYDFSVGGTEGPVIKEGHLRKQGHSHRTWKKRWFELDKASIRYHKTKKDLIPIDTIELKNILQITTDALDPKKPTSYIQLHTSSRTYQIEVDTKEERDQWVEALNRNHTYYHSELQDKFIQKMWIGDPKLKKGNAHLVELYGKHLSFSRSFPIENTVATDMFSWHIDNLKYNKDNRQERLEIIADSGETQYLEVGSLDIKGQEASKFLSELVESIEHNKKLETSGDHWAIRYKRGFLNVSVGKYVTKSMWVQICGLLISFFDKPESPKATQILHLARLEVALEHYKDDRHPDRIVLKPTSKDSNSKTWVTLSGMNMSSLKPDSELNRLEWVVSLCGNQERLRKEALYDINPDVVRLKRGWLKFNGRKIWCEVDELTFRVFATPKSGLSVKWIMLVDIKSVEASAALLRLVMKNGTEYKYGVDNFSSEWKNAIDNNISVLEQIKSGQPVTVSALAGHTSTRQRRTRTFSGQRSADDNKIGLGAEIPYEDIQLASKLGDGCFGEVYKGICRSKEVAVKIPLVQTLDESQLEILRKEVAIMSANPHPNIVQFMGACTVPGNFRIVTELLDGDLDTLLKRTENKFSLYERMKMAKDAALGMNWLHKSNPQIIHRDLKTANLLYFKTGTNFIVKVCDFGLSTIKQDSLAGLKDSGGAKGTPLYMAPEVMLQEEFNEKADVYSFGIVLWEILTKKDPFPHHTDYQLFVKAIVEDGERPFIPSDCPDLLRKLIDRCWDPYPDQRPDFHEINNILDELIIECAITDKDARKFWKKYFLKQYDVPWIEFATAFYSFLDKRVPYANNTNVPKGPDEILMECLRILFVDEENNDEEEIVKIERFEEIINWFGPLKPKSGSFLSVLTNVLEQGWFHGSISNSVAQQLLAKESPGTFLVRFSTNPEFPGAFAVALVSSNKSIGNLRILHTEKGYLLDDDSSYPTLVAALDAIKKPLNLLIPCHGSRFASLFQHKIVELPTYGQISNLKQS